MARMVDRQPLGNRTDRQLICDAMGDAGSPIQIPSPIALRQSKFPSPTFIRLSNLHVRPEVSDGVRPTHALRRKDRIAGPVPPPIMRAAPSTAIDGIIAYRTGHLDRLPRCATIRGLIWHVSSLPRRGLDVLGHADLIGLRQIRAASIFGPVGRADPQPIGIGGPGIAPVPTFLAYVHARPLGVDVTR